MKIKICGIRRIEDTAYLNEFSPDYAGFILSEGFRRTIVLETFCELNSYLDKGIKRVGVFVNEPIENILKYYAEMLDVIQLHGDEDKKYIEELRKHTNCEIWKAVRTKSSYDIESACKLPVDKLLIDSFSEKSNGGGIGKRVDLEIVKNAKITMPFLLAGGLDESNIISAVNEVNCYGADLSSSVETGGVKDKEKIKRIISLIRNYRGNYEEHDNTSKSY